MKKKIIKPFDLEKAKNGAKLQTKGGYPVEIFKWDARGNYPIKGIIIQSKEDVSSCWTLEGTWFINPSGNYSLVIVEEIEEPKFKVGDWITNGCNTLKVLEIKENYYVCDNKIAEWYVFREDADANYHLWTLDDANDGDVLADGNFPFIFKKIDTNRYSYAYCGINAYNDFKIKSDCESSEWTWMQDIKPATKEQRDILFQKMKEAGYEWNAEKLELKKIKHKFWSDDKSNTFDGFIINTGQSISKVFNVPNIKLHRDVFVTKMQAKSALAMSQISQIMANDIKNFGGVVTDEEWENNEWKFVIYRNGCSISTTSIMNDYYFLAFHTEKQRNLFLEKYPQLVHDFLMIPDEETK